MARVGLPLAGLRFASGQGSPASLVRSSAGPTGKVAGGTRASFANACLQTARSPGVSVTRTCERGPKLKICPSSPMGLAFRGMAPTCCPCAWSQHSNPDAWRSPAWLSAMDDGTSLAVTWPRLDQSGELFAARPRVNHRSAPRAHARPRLYSLSIGQLCLGDSPQPHRSPLRCSSSCKVARLLARTSLLIGYAGSSFAASRALERT